MKFWVVVVLPGSGKPVRKRAKFVVASMQDLIPLLTTYPDVKYARHVYIYEDEIQGEPYELF